MSWFSILLPILALLVWSAGLIARAVSAKVRATAGITVLLVGLSLICFLIVFFRLKWARHQFDWKNGIFFFLTWAFLTGYQFVCVFVPEKNSTFGISSVFLSANCLVMMAIVFMNHSVTNGSIDDLIQNKIQPGGAVRDPNRTTDFDQEVDSEKLNKDYVPT
jgi:drug/metabolite transporter (DMT)-like permease